MPIEICNAFAANCVPDWNGVAAISTAAATAAALLIPPWQRSRDRRERENALAYSLFLKMMKIHSDIFKFWEHVLDQRVRALEVNATPDTWQFFLPLASFPNNELFTSDELAVLFAAKDNDVFNAVLSMDVVHSSDIANIQLYGDKRKELTKMLPGASMNGSMGTTDLTAAQAARIAPYSVELNMFLADIVAGLERHVKESESALRGLHRVITSVIKMKIGLVLPSDTPTPAPAQSAKATPLSSK